MLGSTWHRFARAFFLRSDRYIVDIADLLCVARPNSDFLAFSVDFVCIEVARFAIELSSTLIRGGRDRVTSICR